MTVKVSRNYNEEYAVTLPSNFPDFLSREGAADWVEKNLPKCVYMDDYLSFRGYHRNLPQLAQKKNKPAELTEDEKTILIVFHLAALDIDDIVAKAGGAKHKEHSTRTQLRVTSPVSLRINGSKKE